MDAASLLTLQGAQTSVQTGQQNAITTAATHAGGKSNAKLGADFESMVISQLLQPMFEGIKTNETFGGGEGEDAMKSFYIDAVGKEVTKHGGLGISTMMQKELLKLQGAH